MVFGTKSPMGIKVFKEAEAYAASLQDEIEHEKEFGDQRPLFQSDEIIPVSEPLREKYRELAFLRVEESFENATDLPYSEVFCRAMAMPLVTERKLVQFLNNHRNLEICLDGKRRKRPDIKNPRDRVIKRAVNEE